MLILIPISNTSNMGGEPDMLATILDQEMARRLLMLKMHCVPLFSVPDFSEVRFTDAGATATFFYSWRIEGFDDLRDADGKVFLYLSDGDTVIVHPEDEFDLDSIWSDSGLGTDEQVRADMAWTELVITKQGVHWEGDHDDPDSYCSCRDCIPWELIEKVAADPMEA